MSRLHRAQILIESDQHEALTEIAETEGRSMSDVVREILRLHLHERSREAEAVAAVKAIDRLTEIRSALRETRGVYQGDPLAEVREAREKDMGRVWRDEL